MDPQVIASILFATAGAAWSFGVMWGKRDTIMRSEFEGLRQFVKGYNGSGGGLVQRIDELFEMHETQEWNGTKYSRHRQEQVSRIVALLIEHSGMTPDQIGRELVRLEAAKQPFQGR